MLSIPTTIDSAHQSPQTGMVPGDSPRKISRATNDSVTTVVTATNVPMKSPSTIDTHRTPTDLAGKRRVCTRYQAMPNGASSSADTARLTIPATSGSMQSYTLALNGSPRKYIIGPYDNIAMQAGTRDHLKRRTAERTAAGTGSRDSPAGSSGLTRLVGVSISMGFQSISVHDKDGVKAANKPHECQDEPGPGIRGRRRSEIAQSGERNRKVNNEDQKLHRDADPDSDVAPHL